MFKTNQFPINFVPKKIKAKPIINVYSEEVMKNQFSKYQDPIKLFHLIQNWEKSNTHCQE